MKFWWRDEPPLWTLPLAPLSALYAVGARFHPAFVKHARAPAKVISVGNLTAGGAGKTPVVACLAERLRSRGLSPAILSRGYGRSSRAPLRVRPDTPPRLSGDEPLLLARRGFDVWVGPSRLELAKQAVAAGAQVLLLDDGLQHHALARDLDVLVLDAANPFGNGALLPRGPLRERPEWLSRVRRGLLWLTRSDQPRHPAAAQLPPWPVVESRVRATGDLRGKSVFLFAGIARPQRFEESVRQLGAQVIGARWFPDHHWYSPRELVDLRRRAGEAVLLTTEKDLARLQLPAGIVALPIEVSITSGEDALEAALGEALR